MNRTLTPYEQTHLARFGMSGINIDNFGEMPVEYITGKVEFDNKIFQINKDTLIPRIETEELINLAFENIKKVNSSSDPIIIADVGCGSGAIGICLAERMIQAQIPFQLMMSEISLQALEIANQNISLLLTTKKIEEKNQRTVFSLANHSKIVTFVSDLLEDYPDQLSFDLLVANLPYIPTARINILQESVKNFEPHIALDGGIDGLQLIKKFTQQAKKILKPTGRIFLEVDYTHDQETMEKEFPDFKVESIFDQFSRQRFTVLQKDFSLQ